MFKRIPKNVVFLGLVSFFNDVASEMIYPIIPIFLTSVLHVPVSVIGLIEGFAEGIASLMRFVFGYVSDRFYKRKIFVIAGYGFSSISKPLIALAYSWPFVLFARFFDRLGKGVRTSSRDSILLQSTNQENKGYIFGFHRAMDSMGAVIGPLIALILLYFLKDNMRLIFLVAFIPSVIGIILLILFVKERKNPVGKEKFKFNFKWKSLNPNFKFFLLVSLIFAIGNSSDAFLILRAQNLGLGVLLTTLTYVLYNASQTIFATPAGLLADKIGAKRVYSYGLLVFAAVYFSFGIISSSFWIWFLFPIYGLYIAATDGVSKAYIAEFITEKQSGTYFGIYQSGIALCTFLASFIAGLIWTSFGPSYTFFYGAAAALLSFIILLIGKTIKVVD
jgi:MFS family permease